MSSATQPGTTGVQTVSGNTEEKAVVKSEAKAPIMMGERGLQFTQLHDIYRFAEYVSASGFAPKGVDKPAAIVVAIQMGLELGLPPMMAIQNIAVINGRPSIYGDAAKALVESSGLCEWIDESYEGEGDNRKWICEAKRRGRPKTVKREFSVADAKRANLWSKEGPWKQYPDRMLQMRARGFCLRDAFPDILKGLYTSEEARDIPREAIDVTDSVPAPRNMDELTRVLEATQEPPAHDPETGEIAPEPDKPKEEPKAAGARRTAKPAAPTTPVASDGQADIGV